MGLLLTSKAMENFRKKKYSPDLIYDLRNMPYPTIMRCHNGQVSCYEDSYSTHFGYVLDGDVNIVTADNEINLKNNYFFSAPMDIKISGPGKVVVCTRIGYHGIPILAAGPIEEYGRVIYIDSCSSTILVPPLRLGDPGLHHLLFPPNIKQSSHVHPTKRIGVINKGSGHCILADQRVPLQVGDVFYLGRGMAHHFESGPHGLEVITYHPDSNTGPTDDLHPMKSATYLVK